MPDTADQTIPSQLRRRLLTIFGGRGLDCAPPFGGLVVAAGLRMQAPGPLGWPCDVPLFDHVVLGVGPLPVAPPSCQRLRVYTWLA